MLRVPKNDLLDSGELVYGRAIGASIASVLHA